MAIDEKVLCFERRLLDDMGCFQGINFDVEKHLRVLTSPTNLTYRPRAEAEGDKRYKQLIPYVILQHRDRVLHYRRGKGGGEARLHGLFSIGIGGHISDEDNNLFSNASGYYDGMWRELKEEVDITPMSEAAVAVINDDSNDVGSVHFAIVHIIQVADELAVGHRRGIVAPEFVPIAQAKRDAANYETWSSLCLENFGELERIFGLSSKSSLPPIERTGLGPLKRAL